MGMAGKPGPEGEHSANGWVGRHQMIFMCMPIRTAVFFCGVSCMLAGLVVLAFQPVIERDRRPFVGGYSEQTRIMIDLLETSGLLWGFLGAAGALYLRASWLRTFYCYQGVRLLAWFVMYALDVPLLSNCELGRDDPKAFTALYGPNQAMLKLAASGLCDDERGLLYMLSPVAMLLFLQFFLATQRLLAEIDEEPVYVHNMDKAAPSGSYYQKSMGSMSATVEHFAEAGVPMPGWEKASFAAGGMQMGPAMPLMASMNAAPDFGSGRDIHMPLRSMA